MSDPLSALPSRDRLDVLEAVAALRASGAPIAARDVRALGDARLREIIEIVLAGGGRVLVRHQGEHFAIGYADAIADALIEEGVGVLDPVDRAVLCLALLHTVAIPRARSRAGSGDEWHDGTRVPVAQILGHYRGSGLHREVIEQAIPRLKHLGLLRNGHDVAPGPALARLTPRRRAELWEDLVLICAPSSARARHIAEQRSTPEASR